MIAVLSGQRIPFHWQRIVRAVNDNGVG